MKKNLKTLLTIAIILSTSFIATAQNVNKLNFGIGLDVGMPLSNLKDETIVGIGLDLRLSKGIVQNLDATFTTGFISFFPKEYENANKKTEVITVIPFKLGGRYMFTKNLYGAAEAGVDLVNTFDYDIQINAVTYTYKYKYVAKPYFSYTVGVGARFGGLDLGTRYEDAKIAKFVALRLGYDF